jgi:hypothetical protein
MPGCQPLGVDAAANCRLDCGVAVDYIRRKTNDSMPRRLVLS